MEVGTLANLISSGTPPMTWMQTVRLVGLLLLCAVLLPPPRPELSLQVLDVACGLSYLHGSSPPLLHSHLRGNTVLVSASLRAKLSTEVGGLRCVHSTVALH